MLDHLHWPTAPVCISQETSPGTATIMTLKTTTIEKDRGWTSWVSIPTRYRSDVGLCKTPHPPSPLQHQESNNNNNHEDININHHSSSPWKTKLLHASWPNTEHHRPPGYYSSSPLYIFPVNHPPLCLSSFSTLPTAAQLMCQAAKLT